MNHAYGYNQQETYATVINRIYYLMNTHGWSMKTLSDQSNIPYETLKKLLNRKIESTSIHNIVKIAAAFQCNIDFLLGADQLPSAKEALSEYSQNIITYLKQVDFSFSSSSVYHEGAFIPIYTPDSLFTDEYPSLSAIENLLDIGSYPPRLKETITCGIMIQGHSYHPVFHSQDILLIARDRVPRFGETGIFIHNGFLYIRKFCSYCDHTVLEPINGIGKPICIKDLSEWYIFGYVIGVHRSLPH